MNQQPEYMEFAVEAKAVTDVPRFAEQLKRYLLKNTESRFGNRIRSIRIRCSQEGAFKYLDVSFSGRSMGSRGAFFLHAIQNIAQFVRFFSVQPIIVFYNDEISRPDAMNNGQICEIGDLDSARFPPAGMAISFSDLSSFYFCVFAARALTPAGQVLENDAPQYFMANATVFCVTPEECVPLIQKYLSSTQAELVAVEEITPCVPIDTVPDFDYFSFARDIPKVIHCSGRVYYG